MELRSILQKVPRPGTPMSRGVITAVVGAFWAIVYVRRRSIVAPLVSHSGFNLLELAQYLAIK